MSVPAPSPVPIPSARSHPLRIAVFLGTAVVFTAAKLWLASALPLTATANATNDDALFIRLADALLRGEWLGAYDHLTLSKGPAYPLFIAAAHLLHLPLPLAQQLLYATACAALASALAPLFRLRWFPWLLYLVLLFNPMTLEGPVMARVLRQHLATPATLLMLAGFAGLWVHTGSGYYRKLGWSLLAGGGLAAAWLCREESSLLLPAATLLFLGATRAHRHAWLRRPTWILLALPWLVWGGSVAAVCALNLRVYGAWTTVEFRTAAFADAYGALTRVRPQEFQPYVPVARETRLRLYQASPAFAELRDYFEGEPGRAWASYGTALTGRPAEEREIAGGWFMWALRDAAAGAGHARDARSALTFYRRLADEVNAACADRRLDARPARSGFLPPWHEGYRPPLLRALRDGVRFLTGFEQFSPHAGPSSGDPDGLALFQKISRAPLAPPEGAAVVTAPTHDRRLPIASHLAWIYQQAARPLGWLALVGFLLSCLVGDKSIRTSCLVLAGALLLTLTLSLGAIALIHVSSFPALITGYFHGSYPLYLTLVGLGLGSLMEGFWFGMLPRLRRPAS